MVKRLTCLLFVFILCINITSCKIYNNINQIELYEKECRTVAECIVDEDREAIYEMFCDECKDIDGFEEEFNNVLDILYSYDLDYTNMFIDTERGGGSSARKGKLVEWSRSTAICDIYDTDGNQYLIAFSYVGINVDNPEIEGLTSINLSRVDESGHSERILYIGRFWNIQNQRRFYYYPEE